MQAATNAPLLLGSIERQLTLTAPYVELYLLLSRRAPLAKAALHEPGLILVIWPRGGAQIKLVMMVNFRRHHHHCFA